MEYMKIFLKSRHTHKRLPKEHALGYWARLLCQYTIYKVWGSLTTEILFCRLEIWDYDVDVLSWPCLFSHHLAYKDTSQTESLAHKTPFTTVIPVKGISSNIEILMGHISMLMDYNHIVCKNWFIYSILLCDTCQKWEPIVVKDPSFYFS